MQLQLAIISCTCNFNYQILQLIAIPGFESLCVSTLNVPERCATVAKELNGTVLTSSYSQFSHDADVGIGWLKIGRIFLVERTEVEPFDRIAEIEWNTVEFDRSFRVHVCLKSIDYHNVGHILCMQARSLRRQDGKGH